MCEEFLETASFEERDHKAVLFFRDSQSSKEKTM